MRGDSYPAKIKTVRVPTGLDCNIRVVPFVRVAFAGSVQQFELAVIQVENFSTKLGGEFSSAGTMLRITHFANATRVVQQGEQTDDFDVSLSLFG
jgi:hypothetical protein